MHYLDTSVLAALYLPEAASARVQKLVARSPETVISVLSEVELHSAVSRRVRMRELPAADGQKVLAALRVHLEDGVYRLLSIESRDFTLACDWLATFRTPLRTLDALHLAIAFSHGLELVTADKDLAEAAKGMGVKHRLIA